MKVFAYLVVTALFISVGCASTDGSRQLQNSADDTVLQMEQQWGIEVVAIRLTAAEYMLDFRYRIVDPDKAKPLVSKAVKPHLIDQKTGSIVIVPVPPKIGPLRSVPEIPVRGQIEYILFANPGSRIKSGDKVTVVIGNCKIENLVVE